MSENKSRGETFFEEDIGLDEPPMFKVILLNDDYTPMDFVVMILMGVFHKDRTEAEKIMLQVHNEGSGLCGIYPHDVAETKVTAVECLADESRYPLRCVMEEA